MSSPKRNKQGYVAPTNAKLSSEPEIDGGVDVATTNTIPHTTDKMLVKTGADDSLYSI